MLVSTLMHKEWYAWIGQRVCINRKDVGTLKYFGEIKFKSGFWCGVELDEPMGETDGTMSGIQYFKCKADFGIFVPMHEVVRRSRSTESVRLLDLSKLKVNELSNTALKKTKSKKSLGSLNQTFDMNKNKPSISCHASTGAENRQIDSVVDVKNVNVRKRSKNSSHRVGTEESLGILSNLLEDDGSGDPFDSLDENKKFLTHESEDDCVFSPPINTVLPRFNPHMYQNQFDKQVPFNVRRTSTPKPSFKNIFDLGTTVKLDEDQFAHSFHDEIEPIIAGSNATKSMDFDLTNFKQSEILCSTSKLTIPIFPNESLLLKEIPCTNNDELECNESITDMYNIKNKNNVESKDSMDNFPVVQIVPASTNVLNATYEIDPEQLENHSSQSEQVTNKNLALLPAVVNSNKKSNLTMDLNATFVLCADSPAKESVADKTFVFDHSPAKPLERSSSVESEINFEKKSLSIIFENTINENLSVKDAVECVGKTQASYPSRKPGCNTNGSSLEISSENIDTFEKNSTSSVEMADKEQKISNLNSTFCIVSEDVKSKRNPVLENVNKRYSLSSILTKNNVPIQQRKSDILENKFIKHPQSSNNQKTAFKVPASYGATMKTKVIKNSTITISNKKSEVKDKIALEDSLKPKLSSKDNMKAKCIGASVTEQSKRNVNSYKSVYKQTQQKEHEVHVTLKITEQNTHIVARRKSVGGVVTKVTSKISYASNRKSISENPNINLKVNNETRNVNAFNSTNLTNAKHGIVNRRHTMMPTISSNGMQAKTCVAKSKSDISNYTTSTGNKPTATLKDKKCLQSSTDRDSFGNKKENERDNAMKKPAPVERIQEDSPKGASSKLGNKLNEKTSIPRRELLKPGMLSRLPVAAKSIKKPGFLATAIKPIKT